MEVNGSFLSMRLAILLPKKKFRALTASYEKDGIRLSGPVDMAEIQKAMIADPDLTRRHWIRHDERANVIVLTFKEFSYERGAV